MFCKKICSKTFRNIHRKTPVLVSLFDKVAGCNTYFDGEIGREIEFGTLLTNLSKALGSINHPLLTSKINSYGVFPLATNIISSYLSNRTQRNKFKENFREISI